MGKYNSSLTRVVPVFDELMRQDPTGGAWIHRLLELPRHGACKLTASRGLSLRDGPEGVSYGWGQHEVALLPPLSLLRWLVRNADNTDIDRLRGSRSTIEKRRALLHRDPIVMSEALELLNRRSKGRGWHILEGPSHPDAFLDTDEAVIVIEGKRTERGPTIGTTFMSGRHQMLRHMDCAWEIRGQREVYGFFIVEGPEVSSDWATFTTETVSDAALSSSLPHRTVKDREFIKRGFLGVTTWQEVCDALGLDRNVLIQEVAANYACT